MRKVTDFLLPFFTMLELLPLSDFVQLPATVFKLLLGATRLQSVNRSIESQTDSAHKLSTFSMQAVFGSLVRLRTRELYTCIVLRASWKSLVALTAPAIEELRFWINSVNQLNEKGP
jgi:choline-glycine betaine transporter